MTDASDDYLRHAAVVGCLFEVLGSRESLERWHKAAMDVDSGLAASPSLKEAVRAAAGRVKRVHRFVEESIKAASAPITAAVEPPQWLPSDIRSGMQSLAGQWPISSRSFSDTLFVWTPIARIGDVPVPRETFSMLVAAASAMTTCLAAGIPIRGAIDIGFVAMGEVFPDQPYGPILNALHHLESRIADYPRIVVGDSLRENLVVMHDHQPTSPTEELMRRVARECRKLTWEDHDGRLVVDWASLAEMAQGDPDRTFAHAQEYARMSLQRAESTGDEKIAAKYRHLNRYLAERTNA